MRDFIIKAGVLERYTGEGGDVVVPEGVTSIGQRAFQYCENLTSITLPEGLTSIESEAFYWCENLTSITLPEGLTSIGVYAFYCCKNLTSITLPKSLKSVGEGAFQFTPWLEQLKRQSPEIIIANNILIFVDKDISEIIIPEGVTSIVSYAFEYCENLTSITLPEGLTSIGSYAFRDCSSLTSITLPEGLTSIGEEAFYKCSNLTSITLPKSLKSVGLRAFQFTPWLEQLKQQYPEILIVNNIIIFVDKDISKIIIPEEVTSIGGGAFRDCSSLTSITLPEGVRSIGSYAFSYCSSLTSITLPEGVRSIGDGVFRDCRSLTSITLPEGVTSIGSEAFCGCRSLTSITLPEGVTSIGFNAFGSCESLTSITLPEGVTSIRDDAFSYCSSLTSITLPEGVTSIGFNAFGSCESLTSITLPEGVTSIGSYAFSDCRSLTSITLPEGVTSIGENAFEYCKNLTSITFPPNWDGDSQWLENLSSRYPNLIEIKGGNQHSHYYIGNNCIVEKETGTLVFIGENSIFSRKANIRKVSNEVNTDLFYTVSFEKGFFKENEDDKGLLKYRAKLNLSEENCAEIQLYQKGRTWKSLANERKVEKDFNHASYHLNLLEELEELKDKKLITKLAEYTSEYLSFLPKEQVERTYQLVSELKIAKAVKLLEPLMKDLDKKCLSSKNEHETEDEFAAWREEFDEIELAKVLKHNFNVNIDMLCQSIERTDGNPAPEYLVLCAIVPYLMQYQKDSNTDYDIPTSNEALKLLDKNSLLAALAPKAAKRDEKILSWVKLYKKLGGKVEEDPMYLKYRLEYVFYTDIKDLCSNIKLNDETPASEEIVLQAIVPYLNNYSGIVPAADQAAAQLDQESLHTLLSEKVSTVHALSSENDTAWLRPYVRYGGDAEAKEMISNIKEWHNWYRYGQTGRNNEKIARDALYLSESRTAVLYFDKAGQLYSYACMRGTDAETIRNTVLCEFGLDEKGEKIYDLGNRKMRVQLKIDLSLELTDVETGEVKKSLPKRGADVDLYEQAKADLSEIKKNVKKVAKARNNQLFADFLSGKTVSANSWITSYSKNALLNQVARMLVWNQGDKTFIMTDSGCVDCYGNSYTVNPEVEVGVAHPMEMTAEEVTEWQKYFTSRSLKQPFLQVWEPVIDEKEVSKDRYAGIKIPYYRLRSQAKHGITTQMDYEEKCAYVEFADCCAQVEQLQFHKYSIVENEDCFEVTEFEFNKYTRQVNHIVAYLDKITIFDRIANDAADIEKYLSDFTLAQITEFINMAIEKQSNNALAVLMEYKNNKFADYDAMEEFSLE